MEEPKTTVISSKVEEDEDSEETYYEKQRRQILRHYIQRLIYSFKDTYLWKYSPYWEEDNVEEYDDGILFDELPYIIEQRWIRAKAIKMGDDSIDKDKDFPWHGHSLNSFIELNKNLQKCRDEVHLILSAKDVARFRRRNREVYDAYFLMPLCVLKDDEGRYSFLEDGRHRICVAALNDDEVPVWVLEYKKTESIDRIYHIKHFCSGSWRFLNEI